MWYFIRSHPRLSSSILAGVLAGGLLPFFWQAAPNLHFLVAWNMGAAVYLASVAQMCWHASPESIRRRAQIQVAGRAFAVLLALVATGLALVAVVTQLAAAKDLHGSPKLSHVGLAVLTVTVAWAFIHTTFALLYAHDFYEQGRRYNEPGLEFPHTPQPGYLDFFYFAFIIATSGQTADVTFTSTRMRRTGLLHCVLAYFFNAIVLAMTINIAASFF